MTTTLDIPKPTHREQRPVRTCMTCGCWLRSYQVGETCDPCGKPDWELEDIEVFRLISEMPDVRHRREAFEALTEIHER
jgi:hypothetical protein